MEHTRIYERLFKYICMFGFAELQYHPGLITSYLHDQQLQQVLTCRNACMAPTKSFARDLVASSVDTETPTVDSGVSGVCAEQPIIQRGRVQQSWNVLVLGAEAKESGASQMALLQDAKLGEVEKDLRPGGQLQTTKWTC